MKKENSCYTTLQNSRVLKIAQTKRKKRIESKKQCTDAGKEHRGDTALKSLSLGRNRAVSASNPCQPDERSGRGQKAGATLGLIIFSRSYSRAYLLEARLVLSLSLTLSSPREENRSWKTSVFPPLPPSPPLLPSPLLSKSPNKQWPCPVFLLRFWSDVLIASSPLLSAPLLERLEKSA